MDNENEIIIRLEKDLERYDKVFLLREPEKERKVDRKEKWFLLAVALCRPEMLGLKGQRILVLSDAGTGNRLSQISEKSVKKYLAECAGAKTQWDEGRVSAEYRVIQEKEADFLFHLYHMYEFSGRFFVISCEDRYGSLFYFIDTGLLTVEEAARALLY